MGFFFFGCRIDKLTFPWSEGCGDSEKNLGGGGWSGGGEWGLGGGHPWEATDTLVQGQVVTVLVSGRSKVSPTLRLNICKTKIQMNVLLCTTVVQTLWEWGTHIIPVQVSLLVT